MMFNRFSDVLEEDREATAEPAAEPGPWPARLDGLPPGFRFRPGAGIYRIVEKDGEKEEVWLCSPIRVLALPRDRRGEGWGRYVEILDDDGRSHYWSIPAEMFAGDGLEVIRGCLRLGLDLARSNKASSTFLDLLIQWRPATRAITADRLGWADEACAAFVLGDGRVLGASNVVYQHENAPEAAREMRAAGTLEDWRATVAAPCVGNPLLVVTVSFAFAGPLLEPLGLDGGGLHLRGASSRGKSTAQRVAVSVWGSPRFLHTWRATANGLEGVASACNGTLLALDEMGEVSGREAGAAAYMLANGAGKARADRTGRARPAARWCVGVLSSGEIGLADKMAEAGGRMAAGQAVRLLDIPADGFEHGAFAELHGARSGAAFAERLKTATAERHGTAGPAFVEYFIADREAFAEAARAALAGYRDAAVARFDLMGEGQIERAVVRLGLVAAAGELATRHGLTGWPPGTARDAALAVLGLWIEARGGGGAAEARDAVARTRAFIVAHGASRFEAIGAIDDDERPVINRAGWRSGDTYYISTDAWSEVHKGADPTRAARHLAEAGLLRRGDGRNLATRVPGVEGRPRAYCIEAGIMGAGDD